MNALSISQIALIGDEMALSWSDGGESFIKLETLRRNCPCAACQGEPDVTGKVLIPKVSLDPVRSFTLVRHEMVGGYAIQCFWADGHSSGIFGYDLLKRLG
jgi:DUF971 family protein